jgi:methylmalonyl-CoA mutase
MIGLQDLFPSHQFSDWLTQLKKELKEDGMSRLNQIDPIEGIPLISNGHQDNTPRIVSQPGVMPYYRGTTQQSNQWTNIFHIEAKDSSSDNKKILDALMNGADCVRFDLRQSNALNLIALTKGIQFEFIQSQWAINSQDHWQAILSHFDGKLPENTSVLYDHFEVKNEELFNDLLNYFADKQQPFLHINGFAYHECGSNASHEIAFCLAVGNEYLELLLNRGFNIDEAAACLYFSVGIGSNYFIEVSKIRALRWGWTTIISAYSPAHSCSHIMQLNAEIGWMNKSFKDPNTNYLRQTTEAMSAVLGGVNGLLIYPYDLNSSEGSSTKSNRMARTIPLILQDESFMNQVIDPLGGSYTTEQLTNELGKSSWGLFQAIHAQEGPSYKGYEILEQHIKFIKDLRINRISNNEDKFIGMNFFTNPSVQKNSFSRRISYLSFEFLQLENHIENA